MSRVVDWRDASPEERAAALKREAWAPPESQRCEALILEGSPKRSYPRRCHAVRSRDAGSRFCWVHQWHAKTEVR